MALQDRTNLPLTPLQPHPSLNVLIVDDEHAISGPMSLCLETLGYRVKEADSAETALSAIQQMPFDIVLLDVRLGTANGLDLIAQFAAIQPRLKFIIITAFASVDIAIRAMSRGATDFLCKPFTPDQLAATIARAAELHKLESTVGLAPDPRGTAAADADFATTSETQQAAIAKARRIAPASDAILILGEPGIGKSVLARAIHGWSSRPERPFLSMDCAARSPAYVDLAIFGDSIFGGQVISAENPPLVKRCSGGTLLLTHIEALAPASQERLCKLIKAGHFPAMDGSIQRPRDVRIIVTTAYPSELSAPLQAALAEEQIALPPLRERPSDIPLIAQRYLGYLRQLTGKLILGFSGNATDALSSYPWPGNLRELRKVVGDLVDSCTDTHIEKSDLPAAIQEFKPAPSRRPRAGENISLSELEAAHIRAIVSASPSLRAAADVLGIDFQALYRRRKHYGLE